MLLYACLLALAGAACGDPVTVKNSWNGGFEGEFSIPIRQAVNGWTLELTFSSAPAALEIWNADIQGTKNSGKTFILKNKPFNANLNPGDTLSMNFVVRANGANPTAQVQLVGSSGGGGGDQNPPQPTQPSAGNQGPQFPPSTGKYNYNEVLGKSILFYEAQRSGRLPASNRIPWRGNSALGDKGQNGEDLTGGWYDAGDHVKFGFPMAYTVTVLAWGLIDYADAYRAAGQYDQMLDCIKWPLDYFIKAHVSKYEFYGQVGDGYADHGFWGRPEDMTMARPAFKITTSQPGSDLAAETAAAFAAGYLAFKDANPSYAQGLLQHAKDLYEFAERFQGTYVNAIPARDFYNSWSGFKDELAWGAAWLYRATKDPQYLTLANKYYANNVASLFSWDDKHVGYQLLLYQVTKQASFAAPVQAFLDRWLPGGGVSYTPKGFAYGDQWGPARYAGNAAFIALVAADQGLKPAAYRNFATAQIHYLLGDSGRSFVVGFGNNPPHSPHHRASSCPSRPAPCGGEALNNPGPNPQVLNGALVGGPDRSDNFVNNRGDYVLNEVATDYNAGFQSAVAALKHLQLAASG